MAAGYGYTWGIGRGVCRYALLLLLALSSILHHTLYLYLVFKGVGRYARLALPWPTDTLPGRQTQPRVGFGGRVWVY